MARRTQGRPCAYGDQRCAGRRFGNGVGSTQHRSCPKGYAAWLEAQPRSYSAKVKADRAAHEAYEARKAARTQAKAAEPVKPVAVTPDKAQVLAALATIAEWVKSS
jgi:hypothetical protein